MRTTITLDADVEVLLKKAMSEKDLSFKELVNEGLRRGLTAKPNARVPFRQKTYALGGEESFRWDKSLAIAAALEDEELIRKLAAGK